MKILRDHDKALVNRFVRWVQPSLSCYDRIVLRYFEIKSEKGNGVYGQVILMPEGLPTLRDDFDAGQGVIRFGQVTGPIGDAIEVINRAVDGQVEVKGVHLTLPSQGWAHVWDEANPMIRDFIHDTPRQVRMRVEAESGSSGSSMLSFPESEEVQTWLRDSFPPYDGSADLSARFFNLENLKRPHVDVLHERSQFEFFANPLAWFEQDARFSAEDLTLALTAHRLISKADTKIRVVWYLEDGGERWSEHELSLSDKMGESGPFIKWREKLSAEVDSCLGVDVYLRIRGLHVEKLRVFNNLKFGGRKLLRLFQSRFPQGDFLWNGLSQGKKAATHELSVSALFAAGGFLTIPAGRFGNLESAPDLYASDPIESNVLVIECTTGASEREGKLASLAKRADEARSIVSPSTVFALLVWSNAEASIPQSYLKDASERGISVWTNETLRNALQLVEMGAAQTEILNLVAKTIPRQEKDQNSGRTWFTTLARE